MGNLLLDLGPLGVLSSAPPEAAATRLSYLEHEWRDLLLGVDLEFVKARKAYVQVRERLGQVLKSTGLGARGAHSGGEEGGIREGLVRVHVYARMHGCVRCMDAHVLAQTSRLAVWHLRILCQPAMNACQSSCLSDIGYH